MKYKDLVNQVYDFYIGEIDESELKDYFAEWAEKNKYQMPKRIRLLKRTDYNCEGDIISIIHETDCEVYYNDAFRRYCYLNKSEEGSIFEWI